MRFAIFKSFGSFMGGKGFVLDERTAQYLISGFILMRILILWL